MAKRPIIKLPDPLLRRVSKPFERIDAVALKLADDMLETMYAAPGVGLAAIQVGVDRRLIVLDLSDKDTKEGDPPPPRAPKVLYNPEVIKIGDTKRVHEEGCLSIPDVRIEIERPSTLRVRYLDRAGKVVEEDTDGLLATVIQHEVDHLDGRLIIDFLSRLKRDVIIRRFKKQARDDDDVF